MVRESVKFSVLDGVNRSHRSGHTPTHEGRSKFPLQRGGGSTPTTVHLINEKPLPIPVTERQGSSVGVGERPTTHTRVVVSSPPPPLPIPYSFRYQVITTSLYRDGRESVRLVENTRENT